MKMKNIKRLIGIMAVWLIFGLPSLASAADNYQVVNGPKRFYYGHITLVEAGQQTPFIIRENGRREEAVLNLPVLPGDTLVTPEESRCELLFDTGTVIRLDSGSELNVQTILASSLSTAKDISNVVLNRGRIYVMYKQYDRREMLQVLTQSSAVKLGHRSAASIEIGEAGGTLTRVSYGKADVMFQDVKKASAKARVKSGESLRILPDGQKKQEAFTGKTGFEEWNAAVNSAYVDVHKGVTVLPKPVVNLPLAVHYFAQEFGNQHGQWLWDDYFGYVWRPYLNDGRYPWGGWQPYYFGRWTSVGGQLYWVPEEPWGWVPYHLGIWQWDKKLGWVWIPGSLFAPAWVDWEFFFGYSGWRPWSIFDWTSGYAGLNGFYYYGDYWYYNWPYYQPGQPEGVWKPNLIVRKNQLKKSPDSVPAVPKEMKNVLSRVIQGLARGDARLLESARKAPGQLVMVDRKNLNMPRIQEFGTSFEKLKNVSKLPAAAPGTILRLPAGTEAAREADRVFRMNEGLSRLRQAVGDNPASVRESAPRHYPGKAVPGARIESGLKHGEHRLDWNPDIKVARRLGVTIEYSSRRNQIRCPEFNISSADRNRGGFTQTLTSRGVSYSGFVSESGQSSSSTVSSANASTRSSSSVSRTSSKSSSSSGERTKK